MRTKVYLIERDEQFDKVEDRSKEHRNDYDNVIEKYERKIVVGGHQGEEDGEKRQQTDHDFSNTQNEGEENTDGISTILLQHPQNVDNCASGEGVEHAHGDGDD